MIITIDQAKSWLKIDNNTEDEDIQDLVTAAEAYLRNATGKTYDNTNALAKLYCRVLVSEWYENRILMENAKVSEKVCFTLQSIMFQLQYGGDT